MQDVVLKNTYKDHYASEAYKTLRTNIEFSGSDNKVIVLTSSTPNEGKSTVALGLAVSLCDNGKRVLFVDADLRRSVLIGRHRVTKEVKGLSHYLSGQAEMNDVVCRTQEPGLFVIFAGVVPPNPSELLGQKQFEQLIYMVRDMYDYVFIDAPPLGSVIDAAVISRVCDASVFVVAANTVSYKYVRSVKEQLEKTGCPIIGVVLNKVDLKNHRYYGKYYGHYGSGS